MKSGDNKGRVSIQQKDGFKFISNKKTGDSWNARE